MNEAEGDIKGPNNLQLIGGPLLLLEMIYPEPQNTPEVSPAINVPNFPEGKRPKSTDVGPWYGVYHNCGKKQL